MKPHARNFADEMTEMLIDIFCTAGFSRDEATEKIKSAWRRIAERLAGTRPYVSKPKNDTDSRDEQIYAAHVFGKIPLREIGKHYGMSQTTAQRIVRRVEGQLGMKKQLTR